MLSPDYQNYTSWSFLMSPIKTIALIKVWVFKKMKMLGPKFANDVEDESNYATDVVTKSVVVAVILALFEDWYVAY